jgi:predicted dehydrogenase
MLVSGPMTRFTLHGTAASWIKRGLDPQEGRLVAALTAPADAPPDADERAVLIDGAAGTASESPIPRGDYRQFYIAFGNAVRGTGRNPVPPAQAVAVTAVVETAIRSSFEGRALPVPLTAAEISAFAV